MKFGSLNNLLAGSSRVAGVPMEPEVGMGITEIHWTDRHAGTITWVSPSGKSFRYREDKTTRTDSNGMSESQSYTFEPGDGPERTARKTKNGWSASGTKIVLGYRSEYRDFSF
jgi:hypothetical protein